MRWNNERGKRGRTVIGTIFPRLKWHSHRVARKSRKKGAKTGYKSEKIES